MTIEDTEALAAKMYAIYNEARGYMATAETGWDDLTPPEREGWIQVSQLIEARFTPKDEPDHR